MSNLILGLMLVLLWIVGLVGAPAHSAIPMAAPMAVNETPLPSIPAGEPHILGWLPTAPPVGVWGTPPPPHIEPVGPPESTMNPARLTPLAPISTAGLVSPSPAPRP